jgi:hypothetical protein
MMIFINEAYRVESIGRELGDRVHQNSFAICTAHVTEEIWQALGDERQHRACRIGQSINAEYLIESRL